MDHMCNTNDRTLIALLLVPAILLAVFFSWSSASAYSTPCTTRDEVVATLRAASASKPATIEFSYSAALAPHIADRDWMTTVLYDSGIDQSTWSYPSSGAGTCTLTGIVYMEAIPCTTEGEVLTLLTGAKEGSVSIRPTEDLYLRLKNNDWALLYDLEGQAGITAGQFSYYDEPKCVLVFSELTIAENFYSIHTVDDFRQQMFLCSEQGVTSVAFYCPEELYNQLYTNTGVNGTHLTQEVAENCGITSCNFLFNSDKHLVFSNSLEYYPGRRIFNLIRSRRSNELTANEQALLQEAQRLADNARRRSANDAELVFAICEEIAARCQYQLCDTENCPDCERDNAYGPLMIGYANCDGYADAFYLVASLAGLDAGYQHGDSVDNQTGASHIWNRVTLGSNSYFVDLTWADSDTQGLLPYWILMGDDLASYTHQWNPSTSLRPLAASTHEQYFYYPRNGCAFSCPEDGADYLRQVKETGHPVACLMLTPGGNLEDAKNTLLSLIPYSGTYSTREMGESLFLTFRFK